MDDSHKFDSLTPMRIYIGRFALGFSALVLGAVMARGARAQAPPVEREGGRINLPSSKQILGVVPGDPRQLSSLPVSMAVSPDGHWVVTVNAGFGSAMSNYEQTLAVLDTRTGKVAEFPDARTGLKSSQVLFSGLAFSRDGKHVYASMASLTDPEGKGKDATGSGVAVYGFRDGEITPERMIRLSRTALAAGRTTHLGEDPRMGVPYPAGIAVSVQHGDSEMLLIANNLSDEADLMNAASGQVLRRFDLGEAPAVPSTYPAAVVVSKDGRRGFVALSNASEVVELDLARGTVLRKLALLKPSSPIAAGSHPSALALAPDGKTLYVALANRDSVAAIDLTHGRFAVRGYFDARLPGQSFYGAQPEALAVSPDGAKLYCANPGTDAVAVFSTGALTHGRMKHGMIEAEGFIPTEWLPMAVASAGGRLYIATGKATGTGPNNFPQQITASNANQRGPRRNFTYIATLLHGSLAVVDEPGAQSDLKRLTDLTLASNRMKAAQENISFQPQFAAHGGPIQHVIYIIRENRTYDQVLGDLTVNGKPVGNGDASLAMYGEKITPNLHKLALQFGVLDNFYDSAEVSGDGHVWSNTAIGSDALERTWQDSYRGRQHTYDYEGVVAEGLPLSQKIPDVVEPASGYIWGDLARHGKTLYHFGEYIASTFCNPRGRAGAEDDPTLGPMRDGEVCQPRSEVKPGERLPTEWGGEINRYGWAIPLLGQNRATKPELIGHFAAEYPDFNLKIPDQVRVDIFLRHLSGWEKDLQAGHDTMPNFVMLRLPNDHTAGTTPGSPTPSASIADNDLAVGRAVEAISHSGFWGSTAFFILEDDAQNGADHVDAHRSIGLVVSKYAPHGKDGGAFVDSRFYSTVSMVRTMESALGLPPMNNNDALSSMIGSLLTGPGDQATFTADTRNRDNGLIFKANTVRSPGAKDSARMDFSHADRADSQKLNVILWREAMGNKPVPSMLTEKRKKARHDDDDD